MDIIMKYRILFGIICLFGLCNATRINSKVRRSIDLSATHSLIPDARLPKDVVPTNYDLEISFHLGEEQKITAVMTMNLTFNEKADQISFHADRFLELDDRKIALSQYVNKTDEVTLEKMAFRRADYMPKKNVFVIYLKDDYPQGTLSNLRITYQTYLWQGSEGIFKNSFQSEGLFKGNYQNDGQSYDYYATYMRPHNARKVFPCFDEPGFKVPFTVRIGHPKTFVALFNTPIIRTEDKGDYVIDHFEKTPPMSSFTFGLILTQLHKYTFGDPEDHSVLPINFWATKSDNPEGEAFIKETYNKTLAVMEFLQNYFSAKLPLSKLDLVGVPNFSPMRPADNWGLLVFKESELFKKNYYGLAQELSYQWLGSWVTPFWWSDAHINKALSSFLAAYTVLELDNGREFNGKYPMTVLYSLYYEFSKRYPHSRITGMKQETTSFKTELVIRMLNYTLGAQTFKMGIRSFLANNHYGTFFGDDLWNHLTKQAHKDNKLDKKFFVADIANSWITKDRLPVIKITRNYKDKTAQVDQKVYLRERPHDVPEQDKMLWWVPLVIIREDNLDFSNTTPYVWIEKQRQMKISGLPEEEKFIIVNPEEIGPFPVNYDEKNWELLSNYLQKEEGRLSIPTYTRAKLLHDAWNLAYAGDLSFAIAFDMTMFMKYERNHIVWNPIFTFIDHIGSHIDMSKVYKKFETYVRVLLTPLYEELGKPNDGEENWKKDLRSLSKTFLCRAGYKPCIEEAQKDFKVWMDSTDPDEGVPISNECICPVFKWGTMQEWDFGLQRVINFRKENAQSSRTYLLKTLAGCPVQHEKVEKLLNITILDENGNFTENDIFLIFNMLTGGSSGYTSLFNFLSTNWVTIKEKFQSKPNLWDSLISSATGVFTTQEGYDMVRKLYDERKGEFGSAEHIIKKSLTNIKEEAKWSDENLPVIEKWLDKFLTSVNHEDTKFVG